jgi:hypothetical protein
MTKRVIIEIKSGLMQECVVPEGVEVLLIDYDAGIKELVEQGGVIKWREWIEPRIRVKALRLRDGTVIDPSKVDDRPQNI